MLLDDNQSLYYNDKLNQYQWQFENLNGEKFADIYGWLLDHNDGINEDVEFDKNLNSYNGQIYFYLKNSLKQEAKNGIN